MPELLPGGQAVRGKWICAAFIAGLLLLAGCQGGGTGQSARPAAPATQPAAGQQAAPPAEPQVLLRPVFENERIRVMGALWEPKAAAPPVMQEGKDTLGVVGVVVKGGTLEYTTAKGEKSRQKRQAGEVFWQAGNSQLEARQNVGDAPMEVIQVRLKRVPPTRQYTGALPGHKPVLDNPGVAVFDYQLAPGAGLPMHQYAPRVWVVLQGGDLRFTDKSTKPQYARFPTGQVVSLAAKEQALDNAGKSPLRLISVELK
jgi:hypothetical protein